MGTELSTRAGVPQGRRVPTRTSDSDQVGILPPHRQKALSPLARTMSFTFLSPGLLCPLSQRHDHHKARRLETVVQTAN